MLQAAKVENTAIPITFKNIHFVPGLELNLLSVRKLVEINGYKVVFENGRGQQKSMNCVTYTTDIENLEKNDASIEGKQTSLPHMNQRFRA